ncbi:MAG: hypothetical protein ACRC1U_02785, partial [Vibrionaceae bacterium]
MQPTNQNRPDRPEPFTREQLRELLCGRVEGKIYGNLENAVAALHNTPALPATQGGAASATQFDALFEKVDLQMRSLERAPVADTGQIVSNSPDLEDVRSVRTALLNYKSVYEQKMALDDTINQSKQAGGQAS